MKQQDITAIFAAIITVVVITLIFHVFGSTFLDLVVKPQHGITFERWIPEYHDWVLVIGTTSLVCSLGWLIISKLMFKVNSPNDTGRRLYWACGLFLQLGIFTVVQILKTPVKEGNLALASIFFLLALFGYYIPTVLFTPSSYKYAPLGASVIRTKW